MDGVFACVACVLVWRASMGGVGDVLVWMARMVC